MGAQHVHERLPLAWLITLSSDVHPEDFSPKAEILHVQVGSWIFHPLVCCQALLIFANICQTYLEESISWCCRSENRSVWGHWSLNVFTGSANTSVPELRRPSVGFIDLNRPERGFSTAFMTCLRKGDANLNQADMSVITTIGQFAGAVSALAGLARAIFDSPYLKKAEF
jgi:hypothetical protein